jgi:hypothetical protein
MASGVASNMAKVWVRCELCNKGYYAEDRWPNYCVTCFDKGPIEADDVIEAHDLLKEIDTL